MAGIEISNWKREIRYCAHSVERVDCVEDIVRIVRDTQRFPSPVRVRGSHHSTTRCIVAEGGTVIDVRGMNRIVGIDRENLTVTMQAGVLHIDAARELEKHGLQFYVNVELGNLTVGSAACGGTKDASYISAEGVEYGQVASYCVGVRTVQANGELMDVTEADADLMAAMRSSYGLLGVIYEVTFKIKPIRPLAVHHVRFTLDEFANRLDELIAADRSMMLYLFPFLDRVVVEYRYDGEGELRSNSWQWRVRNWVWSKGSPAVGRILTRAIPARGLRSSLLNAYNRLSLWFMTRFLRGCHTSPADQIIRYPETAGFAAYTFSIWAFPREEYSQTIRDYYRFCKEYFATHGFRCDLLNVGYAIAEDRQSLFSYTRRGPALTLDPVSTGGPGWPEFIAAYNEFCSAHNGTPLFNQTGDITPAQAKKAFGPEIETFAALRRRYDQQGRFATEYFRALLD